MRSKPTATYRSFSSGETKKFGERLAERITRGATRSGRKGAVVLALRGDLGTGKTTFAQGFLKGLGVKKRVASPTFVIIRRRALRRSHSARRKVFTNIFHIDAYRLKSAAHLAALDRLKKGYTRMSECRFLFQRRNQQFYTGFNIFSIQDFNR